MARLGDVCEILDSKRIPITASDRISGPYPYYGANGIQDYVADYIFDDELILLAEDGGNFGSKDKPIAYRVSGKCWVNNHAHVLKPKTGYDINYVCYSLMYYDVTNLVNGATRQKLTQADMREMVIPERPLEKQKHIATILGKLNGLISLRKQQLAKLDELVKARFVEMFGDPASNIYNWKTISFKASATRLSDGPFGSNLKSEHYVQNGIRVIRLGNIGVGKFIDEDKSFISQEHYEKLKKYTCRAGEIVIGTLGDPNLRACIVPKYIETALNKADCVHYIPKGDLLLPEFACQYINCPETLSLAAGMVHGQTRSRISSGQLAVLPIFVPHMELQRQFSTFKNASDKQALTIQQSLDKLEILKKLLMQEYFG